MIIMLVPRDVREFKPKFIGPFSKREFIGVAVAAVLAILTFAITYPFSMGMTMNQRAVIVLIPGVIPLACGFIDIQGMPIWVYAWNLVIQNFLAPSTFVVWKEKDYGSCSGGSDEDSVWRWQQ